MADSPERRQHTPGGLVLVEVFLYLAALFELLAGTVILIIAATSDRATDLETFEFILAAFLILVGLFNAVLARAIGRGQEWARVVYVALHLLTLLGGIGSYIDGQERGAIFLLIPLVMILLVFLPSSNRYFDSTD